MFISPVLPTNIENEIAQNILVLSENVCIKSGALLGGYPSKTTDSIRELLRITNSYYSNRIETEHTHPIEIEKAMQKKFSTDSKSEALQKLSLSYMDTQKWIEDSVGTREVISRGYIQEIHKKFYQADGMESFLTLQYNGVTRELVPGQFREEDVEVNKHIAPSHENINATFNFFEDSYKKVYTNNTKTMKLLCAIASHHRLVFIHPFLDGNGRVSRLYLDAMLMDMDLGGYGLWNISRGLARDVNGYQKYLAHADMIKQGSKDGNGELSLLGLEYYIIYMLNTALEQIEYMQEMLDFKGLEHRITTFVKLSQENMFTQEPLPKYSELLLNKVLTRGEVERGEVEVIISKSKKTAYSLVQKLLEMDYLQTDSPRGAVRLKFNAFFASKIFPNLIPEQ